MATNTKRIKFLRRSTRRPEYHLGRKLEGGYVIFTPCDVDDVFADGRTYIDGSFAGALIVKDEATSDPEDSVYSDFEEWADIIAAGLDEAVAQAEAEIEASR